uniref:11.9 kDa wall protein n=1 Tax=Tuber dryophilum TaxID=64384 RepID=TDF1_TUBDR|nr:RecName: Full=11.9 kDa wall protein; Flags: Precursor [Tuber dryophilum]AAC64194.1 TDF-1 precursor [Tuber dryophilum]
MSFKTRAVAESTYYIKSGAYYLAVTPERQIITQNTVYAWEVSIEGEYNYLKDPGTTHYLTDNGGQNLLNPRSDVDGKWGGGSEDQATQLINAETEKPLSVPYGQPFQTWLFVKV